MKDSQENVSARKAYGFLGGYVFFCHNTQLKLFFVVLCAFVSIIGIIGIRNYIERVTKTY